MVAVRVDSPPAPIGSVVLLHGFTRAPRHLGSLADDCVALGAQAMRPALGSLWWPHSTNNAGFLDSVAGELAARMAPGPRVLVGHSAGAAAAVWVAGSLRRAAVPVARVILVDGVESPTHLIERAWTDVTGVPVRAICAPPSRGNRGGRLEKWLALRGGDVEVTVLPGMGHGDIEDDASAVYRWGVGDDPARPQAPVLRAWVRGEVGAGLGATGPRVSGAEVTPPGR